MSDLLSRYIFIKGLLEGQRFTIGSVYTPNFSQLPFLEDTFLALSQFQDGHIILGGDLNYILDEHLDRSSGDKFIYQSTKGKPRKQRIKYSGLQHLLAKHNLIDSWR